MSPRPLVHIGMPKCASTWLQRRFFQQENGYYLAASAIKTYYAIVAPQRHHYSDWSEQRQQFVLEKNDKVPVVSFEILVGDPMTGGANGECNMYRIRQIIPEARILLIIREQKAMLRSIYKSLVNFGSPLPLKTHLYNDLIGAVPTFDPSYLLYDRIVAAYQHHFGADSVLVLPYEQLQSDPTGFMRAISEFSEVDLQKYPPEADSEVRDNANKPLLNLEFKRLYNRFVARTRMSDWGLVKPTRIGEKAHVNIPAPEFVHRWMEKRFADRVAYMTAGYYCDSNARIQALTGLDLERYGYPLPPAQAPAGENPA